jgi:flagellar secretion chaperone FliS
MSTQMMRNRYVSESVGTASPARLVTMLYDRLVRDLVQAEVALLAKNFALANDQLGHAQDIIWELLSGLDVAKWSGGPGLAALYQFLVSELVAANVSKDAARVVSCRELVEPLRDAWHKAAEAVVSGTTAERISA